MGFTRARVYHLFEDCAKNMNVRWPEGQYLLASMMTKLHSIARPEDDLMLLRRTVELFFPGNHPLTELENEASHEATGTEREEE